MLSECLITYPDVTQEGPQWKVSSSEWPGETYSAHILGGGSRLPLHHLTPH